MAEFATSALDAYLTLSEPSSAQGFCVVPSLPGTHGGIPAYSRTWGNSAKSTLPSVSPPLLKKLPFQWSLLSAHLRT